MTSWSKVNDYPFKKTDKKVDTVTAFDEMDAPFMIEEASNLTRIVINTTDGRSFDALAHLPTRSVYPVVE